MLQRPRKGILPGGGIAEMYWSQWRWSIQEGGQGFLPEPGGGVGCPHHHHPTPPSNLGVGWGLAPLCPPPSHRLDVLTYRRVTHRRLKIQWGKVCRKKNSGKLWQISWSKCTGRCSATKYPATKCPLAKCPATGCPAAKCPTVKCPRTPWKRCTLTALRSWATEARTCCKVQGTTINLKAPKPPHIKSW